MVFNNKDVFYKTSMHHVIIGTYRITNRTKLARFRKASQAFLTNPAYYVALYIDLPIGVGAILFEKPGRFPELEGFRLDPLLVHLHSQAG